MGSAPSGNGTNSSLSHHTEVILLQEEAGHFEGLEAKLKPEEGPKEAVGQLGLLSKKGNFSTRKRFCSSKLSLQGIPAQQIIDADT